MTDEERHALALAIAEKLPQEIIIGLVSSAIDGAIRSMAYGPDQTVNKLLHEAVVNRAKELLKTKYADRVEKEAELLAARVATELPNLTLKKPGY